MVGIFANCKIHRRNNIYLVYSCMFVELHNRKCHLFFITFIDQNCILAHTESPPYGQKPAARRSKLSACNMVLTWT